MTPSAALGFLGFRRSVLRLLLVVLLAFSAASAVAEGASRYDLLVSSSADRSNAVSNG